MGEHTGIAWCDHTFNPWLGCTKVSAACDFCYAERWGVRFGIQWGNHPRQLTSASNWRQPIRWNAAAKRDGIRRRVFCASLADVFDNQVDPQWHARLFDLITECPNLDWLLLTKRPQNVEKIIGRDLLPFFPQIWLGVTAENQAEYDRRWKIASAITAARHFISYEPALGPLELRGRPFPDWIIIGGESGPDARRFEIEWARSLIAQCRNMRVACFVKQLGARPTLHGFTGFPIRDKKGALLEDWPDDLRIREIPA